MILLRLNATTLQLFEVVFLLTMKVGRARDARLHTAVSSGRVLDNLRADIRRFDCAEILFT